MIIAGKIMIDSPGIYLPWDKQRKWILLLKERKPDQDPNQFLLTMLGMIIFPFLMKPVFQKITDTEDPKFKLMMKARKELIPAWCRAILKWK